MSCEKPNFAHPATFDSSGCGFGHNQPSGDLPKLDPLKDPEIQRLIQWTIQRLEYELALQINESVMAIEACKSKNREEPKRSVQKKKKRHHQEPHIQSNRNTLESGTEQKPKHTGVLKCDKPHTAEATNPTDDLTARRRIVTSLLELQLEIHNLKMKRNHVQRLSDIESLPEVIRQEEIQTLEALEFEVNEKMMENYNNVASEVNSAVGEELDKLVESAQEKFPGNYATKEEIMVEMIKSNKFNVHFEYKI